LLEVLGIVSLAKGGKEHRKKGAKRKLKRLQVVK